MVIQPHDVDVNNSSYKESRSSLQNMLRKTSPYCFLVMAKNETDLTNMVALVSKEFYTITHWNYTRPGLQAMPSPHI
ncbi:hypothetical protein DID88_007320 [Monilinia fructigena]|uniref:Uncharacterized protein n=1 Tax=Monilinia fructigena TaxID=38457 RepID=A0A395J7W9_9HELO|nr:hypothetical protein DID88_007320 [Monilinia fructigena]